MMRTVTKSALLVLFVFPAAYAAEEKSTTLADQREVAVTIYNDSLALVKDARKIHLDRGETSLAWRDVSARIRPETALLRNVDHPKTLSLIEQNFDFDLLTPQKLLEKYVGQKVTVIKTNPATGAETREEATVLATNSGVVLRFPDRIETGVPGRLAFSSVPENLRDRPTLVIRLQSAQAVDDTLELSYLTQGLSWRADYVAELSPQDDRIDLNGWVTLTNESGTTYNNAKLQLVAGDVNRVRDELQFKTDGLVVRQSALNKVAEESLFEYHLYSVGRPTTIADKQTKQVALLSASAVPVTKEFLLRGADYYYRSSFGEIGQKLKVGVFVEFENKGGSLGIPLPKGIVRVYKKDSGGNAQFVGEDKIDHTPKNETVRLKLGDAFDITADKKQTAFEKLAGTSRYNYIFEAAFEIVIKNAKTEPVMVKVMEPIPGDWQMLSESLPHQKAASNTAVWQVPVAAGGKTTLTYKVRVRY